MKPKRNIQNPMHRRDVLRSLVGVGSLGAMGPLDVLAAAGSPATKMPVASAKNLVVVVNMLGYNQHTFNPEADDLNYSPLLAQLKRGGLPEGQAPPVYGWPPFTPRSALPARQFGP